MSLLQTAPLGPLPPPRVAANSSANERQNEASPNPDQESPPPPPRTGQTAAESDEEDTQRMMQHYARQIYRIMTPVICCVAISVFLVKLNDLGVSYVPTQPIYIIRSESPGSSVGEQVLDGLINALAIIGGIIVMTIIFVLLFKYRCFKIIFGWLGLIVIIMFGFIGYLVLSNLCEVVGIPLDYITLAISLLNLAVVGLAVIFWKGPLYIQQAYLIMMSSMLAYVLSGIPEFTAWILLGVLVIWDLIAVLCPFGPLNLLIKSSQEQEREVPALLYSVTMVWFMASPSSFHSKRSTIPGVDEDEDEEEEPLEEQVSLHPLQEQSGMSQVALTAAESATASPAPAPATATRSAIPVSFDVESMTAAESMFGSEAEERRALTRPTPANDDDPQTEQSNDPGANGTSPPELSSNPGQLEANVPQSAITDDEEEEERGLKLGLGDFVFYSVLIARAALYDWVTTMSSAVAVLAGLTFTILLLAIFRRALPALPISVVFGILFYAVTKLVLVPYLDVLKQRGTYI